jgi:hypothetical protein
MQYDSYDCNYDDEVPESVRKEWEAENRKLVVKEDKEIDKHGVESIFNEIEKNSDFWNFYNVQFFSGNYRMSFTCHLYNPREDYSTVLNVVVRSDETIEQALYRYE